MDAYQLLHVQFIMLQKQTPKANHDYDSNNNLLRRRPEPQPV